MTFRKPEEKDLLEEWDYFIGRLNLAQSFLDARAIQFMNEFGLIVKAHNKSLEKYKIFHDHVKSHFEKEHPDWEVKCKICDKNFSEIVVEE